MLNILFVTYLKDRYELYRSYLLDRFYSWLDDDSTSYLLVYYSVLVFILASLYVLHLLFPIKF